MLAPLLLSFALLNGPPAARPASRAGACSMSVMGRREQLQLAGGSLLAALALPAQPASASYAMYKAASDTMAERKASGDWKPGSDRATLASIQNDIAVKRPYSKPSKYEGKYCAGQTSGVQPMLENICANIGISKADQANTQQDVVGNMVIGAESAECACARSRLDPSPVVPSPPDGRSSLASVAPHTDRVSSRRASRCRYKRLKAQLEQAEDAARLRSKYGGDSR